MDVGVQVGDGQRVGGVVAPRHADGAHARVARDLHVDGRTLRLRTNKKPAEKPAGYREAIREFDPDLNYAVSVDLPELADPATIKATVENGVLRVFVAKRPENQPRRIEIG